MTNSNQIIETIEKFCRSEIQTFLNKHVDDIPYPKNIISSLADLGLFGINIPEEYGGSRLPISLNLEINRILSKYWLSIPALYGTHLRANQYLMEIGTNTQKNFYLPKMADGSAIFAHAFHEKGKKRPNTFSTELKKSGNSFILNGEKEWVTNAQYSDFIIVVARNDTISGCSAVIINKSDSGVSVVKDHARRGIEGISLNRLSLNNVKIEPENIIGGSECDATNFITNFRAISALNFAARCLGVAQAVEELVQPYLMPTTRDNDALPVIAYRWSTLKMKVQSIEYYFDGAVAAFRNGELSKSDAHRTKVFCSSTLGEVVEHSRMLCGGTGYASDDHQLIRQLNDAGSLALIDTPNDTLLTWSGLEELSA